MDTSAIQGILAAAPQSGPYVSLVKIGIVVALLFPWALGVQWVDRDTDVVKTKREQWNLIVVSGAAAGYFVLFVPPLWSGSLFVVGLAFWMLLAAGPMVAYVIHRNGRVLPTAQILTIGHVKRLIAGSKGKRRTVKDKGQLVRMADHNGDALSMPDDDDDALGYQAAQDFLYKILWRRASAADLAPGKESYRLVYRVDGVATEDRDGISSENGEKIFRYLKKIAGLNVEEIRRPQKGKICAALLSHDGDPPGMEVQTSGTTVGEKLRLQMDSEKKLLRIHEIGLPQQRLDQITKNILSKSHGMFVLSATPQNGLTTSQYAILRSHDAYMHHIHTLERHVLLEIDNVTQQIFEGANTDVNFARMLQSVLRREPDIVLVGECEDAETAQIATRAASEHRKIYLGMRANDCFDALTQVVKMVNDNALVAKALVGVMNQRLIRKLCDQCREAYHPEPATLKKLNLPAEKIERFYRPPPEPKVDKKGKEIICPSCHGTGYVGRTGLFELMTIDNTIRQMIAEGAPASRIKAQCRKNKMYYLQEEGLLKVIDGTTSMNEVLRCLRANGK